MDTVRGLVDYREGSKAYKSCDFKNSKTENALTYKPGDIIGYGFINDKFFESGEVTIKDQSPQIVFLEVIVSGLVSLYKFEDSYFVEKDSDGLQLLINETKEIYVNGRKVLKYTNQHIGTINMLVFDCAEIRERVQKIKLREKELTDLIEDYNRCKGDPSITFKAKKQWTKMTIGMVGGLNISQLNFSENVTYTHLVNDFENSKAPVIGISFDIFSPRLSERISFHSDLLYLSSKFYNYSIYGVTSSSERNYVTIELQQLKIPMGIRYTFPKREFTPYVNVGISTTIHLGSNSKWIQERESNGVVYTNRYEAIPIKNRQVGLWGGLGAIKPINNKLNAFIEVRYEQTDGIIPFTVDWQDLNSKISNLQVFIGLRIK